MQFLFEEFAEFTGCHSVKTVFAIISGGKRSSPKKIKQFTTQKADFQTVDYVGEEEDKLANGIGAQLTDTCVFYGKFEKGFRKSGFFFNQQSDFVCDISDVDYFGGQITGSVFFRSSGRRASGSMNMAFVFVQDQCQIESTGQNFIYTGKFSLLTENNQFHDIKIDGRGNIAFAKAGLWFEADFHEVKVKSMKLLSSSGHLFSEFSSKIVQLPDLSSFSLKPLWIYCEHQGQLADGCGYVMYDSGHAAQFRAEAGKVFDFQYQSKNFKITSQRSGKVISTLIEVNGERKVIIEGDRFVVFGTKELGRLIGGVVIKNKTFFGELELKFDGINSDRCIVGNANSTTNIVPVRASLQNDVQGNDIPQSPRLATQERQSSKNLLKIQKQENVFLPQNLSQNAMDEDIDLDDFPAIKKQNSQLQPMRPIQNAQQFQSQKQLVEDEEDCVSQQALQYGQQKAIVQLDKSDNESINKVATLDDDDFVLNAQPPVQLKMQMPPVVSSGSFSQVNQSSQNQQNMASSSQKEPQRRQSQSILQMEQSRHQSQANALQLRQNSLRDVLVPKEQAPPKQQSRQQMQQQVKIPQQKPQLFVEQDQQDSYLAPMPMILSSATEGTANHGVVIPVQPTHQLGSHSNSISQLTDDDIRPRVDSSKQRVDKEYELKEIKNVLKPELRYLTNDQIQQQPHIQKQLDQSLLLNQDPEYEITTIKKEKYTYSGQVLHGRRQGRGHMKTHYWVFEGQFVNGYPKVGKLIYRKSGEVFEGELFLDNPLSSKLTGNGIVTTTDGRVLKGQFLDGNQIGPGYISFNDGTTIESTFQNGRPSGITKVINGNDWKLGIWQDNGLVSIIQDQIGDRHYQYQSLDLQQAIVKGPDFIYIGSINEFKEFNGQGILKDNRGNEIKGNFLNNKKHDPQIEITLPTGLVYIGECFDDGSFGRGVLNNGQKAQWINGQLRIIKEGIQLQQYQSVVTQNH